MLKSLGQECWSTKTYSRRCLNCSPNQPGSQACRRRGAPATLQQRCRWGGIWKARDERWKLYLLPIYLGENLFHTPILSILKIYSRRSWVYTQYIYYRHTSENISICYFSGYSPARSREFNCVCLRGSQLSLLRALDEHLLANAHPKCNIDWTAVFVSNQFSFTKKKWWI